MVAEVTKEQTIVEADLAKAVAQKEADASAYEVEVLATARATRITKLANATASGYKALAAAGWTAAQLNALKFAEVVRARVGADNLGALLAKIAGEAAGTGDGMVLDVHQPRALLLPGQAEGYEKDRQATVPNAL